MCINSFKNLELTGNRASMEQSFAYVAHEGSIKALVEIG